MQCYTVCKAGWGNLHCVCRPPYYVYVYTLLISPYTTSVPRTSISPYTTSVPRTSTSPCTTNVLHTSISPCTTSVLHTSISPCTTSIPRTFVSPCATTLFQCYLGDQQSSLNLADRGLCGCLTTHAINFKCFFRLTVAEKSIALFKEERVESEEKISALKSEM